MVDKHRGVRLLEQHTMTVYLKTLEKKLRDIVKTDENQFGFHLVYGKERWKLGD